MTHLPGALAISRQGMGRLRFSAEGLTPGPSQLRAVVSPTCQRGF